MPANGAYPLPLGGARHLLILRLLIVATALIFVEPGASSGVEQASQLGAGTNKKTTDGSPASVLATSIQPLLDALKKTSPNVGTVGTNQRPVNSNLKPVSTSSSSSANTTSGGPPFVPSPIGSPAAASLAPAANPPQPPAAAAAAGLSADEPITRLDYSNINDEILNRNTANLVYFQANFNKCRNCEHFFDTWRELALDIRWWGHLVRLFEINCSDDDNLEVCRRAGATEFPQVRFYWVRSSSLSQDGQRLRILGKSVHAMRHLITDKLMDSYTEHNRLLAKRNQQQQASTLSALMPGTTSTGPSAAGSLAGLLPLLNQLMKPSNSSTGGGEGPLTSITSALGMASSTGGSSSGGAATLTHLMSSLGGFQGISQIVSALMSLASWRRSLTIQPLAANWPELEPIESQDAQRLVKLLPPRVPSLLVMETQEFLYTGLEVMLDLNPYSNQTYIARVRDERSQLTKNLTGREDVRAPALIVVGESGEVRLLATAPRNSNDEELRRLFVRAYDKRLSKHLKRVWSPSASAGAASGNTISRSQEDEEILSRMHGVYMDDLLNTVRVSLMEQVFRHSDLSEDQYNALVKYVSTLINYFPFQDNERLKFFKRLHAWLQNQVSPVDMAEYRKQFHDVDEALGKARDWISCKSLSSINTVPARGRKSVASLFFENPSQLGKVVSNITRLFRTNQQKVAQLKGLVSAFASTNSNSDPVLLGTADGSNVSHRSPSLSSTTSSTTTLRPNERGKADQDDGQSPSSSSIEKLIKGFASGSLGSDSSILKLISSVLTGGAGADENNNDGGGGHPPKRPGAKSKYAREYPCGVWKLAHVLVVSEYSRDSPRKDVKHLVLHSLYQYMTHFYACPTCGNRVSDVSGEFRINLDDQLQDQADSIMLLWRLHNRINKRLELELRPGSPAKQQFPPESLCPKCRAPSRPSASRPDESATNPSWQEKPVLNFLIHHYKAQSIITSQADGGTSPSSSSASSPAPAPLALVAMLLATITSAALVRSNTAKSLGSI